MKQDDCDFITLILHEKDQQEIRLRDLDKSLLQLAFAIVAALSLCAPALLSTTSISSTNISYVYIILTQIIYLGLFYSIMIVRSRNIALTVIAVLSKKINKVREKNNESPMLFNYSFNISDLTRFDRPVWFAVYVIALIIIMTFYIALVISVLSYVKLIYGQYYIYVMIFYSLEVISYIGYFIIWVMSKVDRNLPKIEKQWEELESKQRIH
jgi:hypothetical protein